MRQSSRQLSAISYQPQRAGLRRPADCPGAHSTFTIHHSTFRPTAGGFSLIELMIAIMILGLGMVMVATVFPVSLDMTRTTLQMGISNAAVDAAYATLRLRLPGYRDLVDETPTQVALGNVISPKVLFPDMGQIELGGPTLGIIDPFPSLEYEVEWPDKVSGRPEPRMAFGGLNPQLPLVPWTIPFAGWVPWTNVDFWTNTVVAKGQAQPYINLSRIYTESSFWDAGNNTLGNATWVIDSQNMPANPSLGAVMREQPPYIDDPNNPIIPNPVAPAMVHLADRVYPPVDVETNGAGLYLDPTAPPLADGTQPPFASLAYMYQYVAGQARDRRYAWTAIHRKSSTFQQQQGFLCTLVVTYRGDPSARYARQLDQDNGDGHYVLSDATFYKVTGTGVSNSLRLPRPDNRNVNTSGIPNDTLFPQAWLVALDSVVPSTGTVACTSDVARLLPPDSFFIIAQASGGGMAFDAGTPHKVIGNDYRPDMPLGTGTTLQIARTMGTPFGPVAVWVFPPAIRPDRATFDTRTPVVGVFIREVIPN